MLPALLQPCRSAAAAAYARPASAEQPRRVRCGAGTRRAPPSSAPSDSCCRQLRRDPLQAAPHSAALGCLGRELQRRRRGLAARQLSGHGEASARRRSAPCMLPLRRTQAAPWRRPHRPACRGNTPELKLRHNRLEWPSACYAGDGTLLGSGARTQISGVRPKVVRPRFVFQAAATVRLRQRSSVTFFLTTRLKDATSLILRTPRARLPSRCRPPPKRVVSVSTKSCDGRASAPGPLPVCADLLVQRAEQGAAPASQLAA